MPNRPKLIGVTGGIGSGKSTVCKIFEVLGYKVYYADERAKWLMNSSDDLKSEIKSLFGGNAYLVDGLNRNFIADQVFKDPDLLKKLNAVVHPAVGKDLANWVIQNESEDILFDEAALLFENGSYKKMNANILITAPKDVRISRVLKRDPQRTTESVREIIAQQMSDDQKEPLADFIIQNDGTKSIIKQTLAICKKLC